MNGGGCCLTNKKKRKDIQMEIKNITIAHPIP